MNDAKNISQIGTMSPYERFARIALKIGYSECEVKDLYSTYQFALEEDAQPKSSSVIHLHKEKVLP